VSRTPGVHVLKVVLNYNILLCSNAELRQNFHCHFCDQLCKEDEWLVVEYDKMYPGVVTAVVGSDAEVPVLGRAGGAVKFWKWPANE